MIRFLELDFQTEVRNLVGRSLEFSWYYFVAQTREYEERKEGRVSGRGQELGAGERRENMWN